MFPALYLLPGAMRPDPDLIAFGCFYLDAFSSREPVPTSLENAPAIGETGSTAFRQLVIAGMRSVQRRPRKRASTASEWFSWAEP